MVELAQQFIIKELKAMLEKDITERVVGATVRRTFAEVKAKKVREIGGNLANEEKPVEKKGLKGLSFKKQRKEHKEEQGEGEEQGEEEEVVPEAENREQDDEVVVDRPKKRRKKESSKKKRLVEEFLESDDDEATVVPEPEPETELASLGVRKREVVEDVEPVKKRQRKEIGFREPKKTAKKKAKKQKVEEIVDEIFLPEFDPMDVSQIPRSPASDLSPSPSRSPSPVLRPKHPPRPPSPLLNPLEEDICEDDEDLYFARLALAPATDAPSPIPFSDASNTPPFRKHVTGSARTEGYYKISHAEKSAYVAQYVSRVTAVESTVPVNTPPPQHVTSSRSNRANARRRAQGLEEINQVQRAVALSKGETAASELTFKFNQLQTRKKHLRFARSPIHDWGLYAMERILRGEMVIEYVGEIIRAQVAEKREKAYERQGIGSSYLFRIDEDLVVDATKKGNLG
jgi:hypothetical protein